MGMLRCVVIVATFAVLTKAARPQLPLSGDEPLSQVHTNQRIANLPTDGSQVHTPVNGAGQGSPPENQPQPVPNGSPTFPPTTGSQNPSPTHPPIPPTTSSIPATTTTTTATTTIATNGRAEHCGHFPSPGECQAAFPRYWYNQTSSQCDCYLYGGCDEDIGSYKTLDECHRRCLPKIPEEGPSCRHVYIDDFSISSPSLTTNTPFTGPTAASNKPSLDVPLNAGSGTPAGSETKPVNLNPPVDGQNYVVPVYPEPEYYSYPVPEYYSYTYPEYYSYTEPEYNSYPEHERENDSQYSDEFDDSHYHDD